MDGHEQLADIGNDVELQNELAATLVPQQTPGELRMEVMDSFGAGFRVGGVTVPPPTSGVLCLLEDIGSPFVVGLGDGEDITRKHVLEALYVCHSREQAVGPVYAAVRARMAVERAAGACKESAAHYQAYLDAQTAAAGLWAEFDQAVAVFGTRLGVFDYVAVADEIRGYLRRCACGYEMMTSESDEPEKKTASKTHQGSARSGLRRALYRCVARLLGL